ncbi:histidinol-phosphatase [Desulfomarina sp.]
MTVSYNRKMTDPIPPVSIHGGHSGQFCSHASDSLEEIVRRYIELQFPWVGITEHCPPGNGKLIYPEEKQDGLTPEKLLLRFEKYIRECRRLQEKYSREIRIFVGMEIETCTGYEKFVPWLIKKMQPDYIVGSVHFVEDIGFDYSKDAYIRAVEKTGSTDALYNRYFDLQFEMISLLKPAVVGHFDLIRLFDDDYATRLRRPGIQKRIERNLQLIKDLGLILDLNLRSLLKGADEPYPAAVILDRACELKIPVIPGDDSHGVLSVGNFMETAIQILAEKKMDGSWQKPEKLCFAPNC